jgi:hypothetical protein
MNQGKDYLDIMIKEEDFVVHVITFHQLIDMYLKVEWKMRVEGKVLI